jgi:hypothetical protein
MRARSVGGSPRHASEYRTGERSEAGAGVTRKTRPVWQPTKLGRGQGKYWDPFYEFEQIARHHGEPPKPPEPLKGGLVLLEVLTSKTAAMVMGSLALVAGLVLLVLLVFK